MIVSNRPIFPSEDPILLVESVLETHIEEFGYSMRVFPSTFFSIYLKKYVQNVNLIAKYQLEKIKF